MLVFYAEFNERCLTLSEPNRFVGFFSSKSKIIFLKFDEKLARIGGFFWQIALNKRDSDWPVNGGWPVVIS
jgi:hypothetical protein